MQTPQTTVHIRLAEPSDAAAIAEVQVEAWRESYVGILPQTMLDRLSVGASAASWAQQLAQPTTAVLLAEAQGAAIGFGSRCPQRTGRLLLERFDGEVGALYVRRDWQGRGVGARLLTGLFEHLQADGFEAVSLWVLSANAPARGFYGRMGGELIAEREDVRGGVPLMETAYGWRGLQRGRTASLFTP